MKRVFFLGAGFSTLAGFPLGSNLLDFVRKKLSSSNELLDKDVYSPILERTIKIYNTSGREHFASNLELLLTSFSLALAYKDNDFITKLRPIYDEFINKHGDKRYYFPKHILGRITYGIKSVLLNHHIQISDYGDSPPIHDKRVAGIYDKFFDMLNEGDAIATLNYDLLCEQALWNKGKWSFLDGYGFRKEKEALMGKDKVDLYTQPEVSKVKIFKLHGSINWAGDYESDNIILDGLLGHFHGYKGLNTENNKFEADKAIAIVLPSYLISYVKRKFILDIWRKAKQHIVNCDELFFIGYSLSDIDSSLQYMLYDAISSNQNLHKSKICIINNQPIEHSYEFYEKSVQLKFEKFLDGKCTFINKSFEDWIMGNG